MNIVNEKVKDRQIQYKNMINSFKSDTDLKNSKSEYLKATKMRSILNSFHLTKCYNYDAKVAFIGEEFPSEIMHAMKIIPLNLQMMAALFSKSDNLDTYLKLADQYNPNRDICSNVRSSIGIGLADCLPNPDLVIGNSAPCDGFAKLAFYFSKFYDKKMYYLSTPNYVNDDAVNYYAEQIKNVMSEIASELDIKFNENDLIETIEYSNKAKEYYFKTMDLVKKYHLPSVSKELYEIIVSNPWGIPEFVDIVKTLYEEAIEESKKNSAKITKKRVLWIGQVPNYAKELMAYIGDQVEILYLASLYDLHDILLDPLSPYESIAKRAISLMEVWEPVYVKSNVLKVKKEFNISGIILQNAWGCRNMLSKNSALRSLLTDSDLKILTIDADFMDKEKYAFNHVKNRIDAFLEILL